jgi:hypothetical protein
MLLNAAAVVTCGVGGVGRDHALTRASIRPHDIIRLQLQPPIATFPLSTQSYTFTVSLRPNAATVLLG